MRTITSVRAMQHLAMRWRRSGVPVALVPTMGYLHHGHLSLVERARQSVGRNGQVVVSIYVNPTQFAPQEDFNRYPRDLQRDRKLCRQAGVDVVFAPDDSEMYPCRESGLYSTYVVEEKLSEIMEGASRPRHFDGVTTVVAKLFNIVLPSVAVFGAKDFQQAAIIRRMTADLNFQVKILVAPTVREPDGLAMSSRNKYLAGLLRTQARVLSRAIEKAQQTVRASGFQADAGPLKSQLRKFIEQEPAARVDYIEFFNPDTLQPVTRIDRHTHMALAVFIGKTRLIDNAPIAG